MADKKLNEVPVVSDIVTIFGKRSNGEIVQIDKSNLATLLGGLIGINDSWFKDIGLFKGDLNTIKKSGIYRIQEGSINIPVEGDYWGILLSFYTNIGGAQNSSIQIMRFINNGYYIRSMWYGNWSTWSRITTVDV